MTRISFAPLALAAALAVGVGGVGLSAPAQAEELVMNKGGTVTPTHTGPTRHGINKTTGGGGTSRKEIGPLDPDKFIANCHAAGGGASTDEDGFDQCTDSNGNTIPVPWEE